jgi:predicted aspartyl protease
MGALLGTFSVLIEVGDLAGRQFVQVTATMDTGATYTTLPGSILDRVGVEREGVRRFELADNHVVEYPIGYARLRLKEGETVALVVFASEDTSPLVGATTLEHLSLAVDPIHRQLVPVPALLK